MDKTLTVLVTYSQLFRGPHSRRMEVLKSLQSGLGRAFPKLLKLLVFALFFVNIRSWPIVWHFKVWRPVWALHLKFLVLRARCLFLSEKQKLQYKERWFEGLSPVGSNPFELVTVYRTWASPDDCDFNMHLSNSCYAKNLDMARFKSALAFYPTFFRSGGWIALGATHYKFLREIPMFSRYEMRLSLGTWDHKWFYVLIRYVTHPKNKHKLTSSSPSSDQSPTPPNEAPPTVHLHTPAESLSMPGGSASDTLKQLAASQSQLREPDGAILHCVSISECCFKIGRITVPPSVVMASEGFSLPPPSISISSAPSANSVDPSSLSPASASTFDQPPKPYSHENPPPHWEKVRGMRKGNNLKVFREFLKGGWRDVPESERWWNDALGGVIEEKRVMNLELLEGVQKSMEAAKTAAY